MKAMTPTSIQSMFLLSFVIVTGSHHLTLFHNFNSFNCKVLSLWGIMEIEDIETHALYNDTRHIVFKQSWSKGNLTETDCMFYDMFLISYFYYFQIHVNKICTEIGTGKILTTIQCLFRCEAYNEDPESYFYKVAGNGKDLAYLNFTEGVWVAGHNRYSKAVTAILQKDKTTIRSINNILRNHCQRLSRILSEAGKEAFSKKSKPDVYFFVRLLKSEAELSCTATGFYPRSINITLWNDKENIMDNVMFTEILPNGDGTYQRTAIVTKGRGQQMTVYCRVEHSSLEEPLVKKLNMKTNGLTWLVIGILLGSVICVAILIYLVKIRKQRTYRSITGRSMHRILWRTTDGNVSIQK
ncbi:T-cell surface glycoprotein CD1c-like isoform X2 [Hyla sarda]|uniref:T-cell surface glycoprotein CD1c-like isoform X2 n=1 Tax=Hyla sarda TaxID=327740 RepID=UPI0024C348CD|nr:T-cell surface glycoprotein CD1c-like isoform X2 [Hyla sarda]